MLVVGLTLVFPVVACNRQPNTTISAGIAETAAPPANSTPGQKLPFDRPERPEGISPSESLVPAPHHIPTGTPITIRLATAVSSATAHPGDTFAATLDEPIVVAGQTVAPRGAPVTGKVVGVKPSGRLQDPGYLRVTLAVVTVNGKAIPIQSSSISIKGKSHETRNWESIGGGTAAGALIGGLAGGGKGALIGSTVGAAGGTGFAYATGKKDVGFGAERRLTFRLTAAVDVKG